MKFKIWIKSLNYELIDVSTPQEKKYIQSKTIVDYKFAIGRNVFDGVIEINEIIDQKKALSIIFNELNHE